MFKENPWIAFVLSFIGLIIAGAFLLWLPPSHKGDVSFVDALFTSASAVCVTGLTVLDTGRDFTRLGQLIILVLIQTGALGIMTFVVATTVFMRRKLGLGIKEIIGEEFAGRMGKTRGIVIGVLGYTVSIELLGFLLLFAGFKSEGMEKSAFHALFHSVSAFCNAGFSTFSGNLAGFRDNAFVLLSTGFLIFFGGIGFVNGLQIVEKFARRRRKFTLNAKVALSVSGTLIILGWAIIFLGEFSHWKESIFSLSVNSLFHAITPRTAGFNSLEISKMSGVSIFFTWILMMVGASSGSCGGGIKTNTIGAIFSYIRGRFSGFKEAVFSGRTVSEETVEKAFGVFMFYFLALITGLLLLLWTDYGNISARGGEPLFSLAFEAVSALSTVGLSYGITPYLSTAGKLILIALMLLGRVGIAIFLFQILMREREKVSFKFPEEDMMVG